MKVAEALTGPPGSLQAPLPDLAPHAPASVSDRRSRQGVAFKEWKVTQFRTLLASSLQCLNEQDTR